jgi:hypothetical protein
MKVPLRGGFFGGLIKLIMVFSAGVGWIQDGKGWKKVEEEGNGALLRNGRRGQDSVSKRGRR